MMDEATQWVAKMLDEARASGVTVRICTNSVRPSGKVRSVIGGRVSVVVPVTNYSRAQQFTMKVRLDAIQAVEFPSEPRP